MVQRGLRLLEEAAEAAQACGVASDQAGRVVDVVFSRPVGEIAQELGGVGVTTLALAAAAGVDADDCEHNEVVRVLTKDPEHFRRRNAEKNALGLVDPHLSEGALSKHPGFLEEIGLLRKALGLADEAEISDVILAAIDMANEVTKVSDAIEATLDRHERDGEA